MKLKELSIDEITNIYHTRMVIDFPKAELKPLNYIVQAVNEGIYECLGLYEDETCIGYTFLVKQGGSYLIDYLAIYPGKRNNGAGSKLIRLLKEYLAKADFVIIEVEDPQYAETDEDKDLQTRRLDFYLRNECVDTGLRVRCFGVPFIILGLGKENGAQPDCLWDIYNSYYRAVLPKEMYEKNIERLSYQKKT